MKYSRFEELPVWNSAADLVPAIFQLTALPAFDGKRSFADQLERASLSISNNIAEGFERGTNQELIAFLYIARGSAGEVRSMLCILERMPEFVTLRPGVMKLRVAVEGISKQLGGWIRTLRNSDRKGERFVTDNSKRLDAKARDRKEFLEQLRRQNQSDE